MIAAPAQAVIRIPGLSHLISERKIFANSAGARQEMRRACNQLAAIREHPDCVQGSTFKRLIKLQDAFNSIGKDAGCQKEICELTSLPFIGYKLAVDAPRLHAELLFYTDEGLMIKHGEKVAVTVGRAQVPFSNENVQEVEISRLGEIAIKIAKYILNKPSAEFSI